MTVTLTPVAHIFTGLAERVATPKDRVALAEHAAEIRRLHVRFSRRRENENSFATHAASAHRHRASSARRARQQIAENRRTRDPPAPFYLSRKTPNQKQNKERSTS
jgi:hypothetical protein